jgi:multidrug efflux pump subunit AcrB
LAQIFHEPNEEIEVRVRLPDSERNQQATLEQFPIIVPGGRSVPLHTVVNFKYRRAPDVLLHTDTKLAVHVTAKVDNKINNANYIQQQLQAGPLPEIESTYAVSYLFKGKAEEQEETFGDMKQGLIAGLSLIYIILAWVFGSYGWPLVVMAAIPLGLTGAILGHLLMGMDLTILSLFGFFGLSGIVINDSIILLSEYRRLKAQGMRTHPAIIEASCRRLRAVLLTSLTTIAGLIPLLFESSLQAQFLIPMATSISFGLAYGTVLILIVVPVLLSSYEQFKKSRSNKTSS